MIKIRKLGTYFILTFVSILSIFPFLWMIISSTNSSVDVSKGKISLGNHFFVNLKDLIENTDLVRAFSNSLIIAIITTVIALVITSAAGYGFVTYKSKTKERIFDILLLSMMIPFIATLVPLYRLFGSLNLLNSFAAVILPNVATIFIIFFFRQSAKSFPKDLVEAARIDGSSELGVFFKVFIPTMKSTYAAASIIIFMNSWNNYLWPLIALQENSKKTLPLIISNLNSSYTPNYGMIMMAVLISIIPTTIVFFTMQKSFVEGILGSVK